jgi:DNA-binding PadR family transcriptional regulator
MRELTQQEQNILLSVFHLKDQAYLLAIRNHLKEITGREQAIATIYVPLERLNRLGYLTATLIKPEPKVGGRSVKYYRLTESGIEVLTEMKRIRDRLWLGFDGIASNK